MPSAVILISGRGSNMRSLVEAGCGFDWRAVVSNRPKAAGLEWAAAKGLPARAMDHKDYATREAFDEALARTVAEYAPDYVFLAGFMRILTEGFIARYPRRILNIHPSLLPVFPGLHTHRRALEAGVKLHGATVHFVTPDLDHGPILVQAAVPVLADDTEDTLAGRVLAQEHRIYPQAARWIAEGRVAFGPGDVVQVAGSGVESDWAIAPRDPS
jgi:phosphoribosylglycinamide formyltransferase-1